MPYDGALLVGAISITTLAISRFKCLLKKHGHWYLGVARMDKPLIGDDEIEVNTTELGNVKILNVKTKHTQPDDEVYSG